ncbi:putative fatty acyl-CoA reductase CG5065-like protein, partial [Dinothrombium tinctorium]
MSNIGEYLNGRSVFITGASGFLGKVLLEKLLRDCSGLKRIFILLRAKGGLQSRKRIHELLDSLVFDRVRRENPSLLEKVVPISGDIIYRGLGINPSDLAVLRDEVSIVFHIAATIRFDEPLKRAVNLNVGGTKHVLELCHQLKHIQALVHVSTAYCNTEKCDVKENIYHESIPANKILDAVEWMDDDILESLSHHLFAGRPSSYHYTKALAENLLIEDGKDLNIAVIRPSIITAAWKEPFPGWIDNYYGPTGYLVVSGKGVLRTMHVHKEKICDMVPVDIVANALIVGAWFVGTKKSGQIQVFNCTSGGLNPITWSQIKEISSPLLIKNPSMELFRYPGSSFHSNRLVHELFLQLEHNIPAFFIDFLFKITGHKPILSQIYQKVHRAINALEYFTTNEWTFITDNFLTLLNEMSEEDKNIFYADVRRINWQSYMESYVLGVRRFLLKEDPSTIPEARKRLQ